MKSTNFKQFRNVKYNKTNKNAKITLHIYLVKMKM